MGLHDCRRNLYWFAACSGMALAADSRTTEARTGVSQGHSSCSSAISSAVDCPGDRCRPVAPEAASAVLLDQIRLCWTRFCPQLPCGAVAVCKFFDDTGLTELDLWYSLFCLYRSCGNSV